MYEYEMMCVFDTGKPAEETYEKVEAMLASYGGEIEKRDDMETRRLAYKIGKKSEGRYFLWHFKLDPNKVDPLKKELRIQEGLMRNLVVRRNA
jgi:ribosomal protein S6